MMRNGTNTSFGSLKQINVGLLNVGYAEAGKSRPNGTSTRPPSSAATFDHPDHVSIVIHNYRWRLGLAEGEPEYDELEQRLAEGPNITVPTITLEGDANGAPHPQASAYAKKFSGRYEHRVITGGVGHNLPQEAPLAFAQAIVDVDAF
jgi:pimeloyl-ACP methyl ester carboxylesterase